MNVPGKHTRGVCGTHKLVPPACVQIVPCAAVALDATCTMPRPSSLALAVESVLVVPWVPSTHSMNGIPVVLIAVDVTGAEMPMPVSTNEYGLGICHAKSDPAVSAATATPNAYSPPSELAPAVPLAGVIVEGAAVNADGVAVYAVGLKFALRNAYAAWCGHGMLLSASKSCT